MGPPGKMSTQSKDGILATMMCNKSRYGYSQRIDKNFPGYNELWMRGRRPNDTHSTKPRENHIGDVVHRLYH